MTNDRIDAAATWRERAGALAGALAVAATAIALFAGRVPAAHAQAAASDPDVHDAESEWHFARIDGFYRIDGRVVACVQKADGHWDFWDPRRDALLGTKNLDCLPPSGSRTIEPTIVSHQLVGSPSSIESDASFSGATGIWWRPADFQHCDTAFDHVYTAEAPGDGQRYSFYVLARRHHAHPVDLSSEACAMVPGVVTLQYTPRYDDTLRVQSLDLGEHRSLIVTRDDDDHPVVLVLHDHPARAWTGPQGVSIVPAALLQPALDKAGPDFAARERVVARLLEGAR